MYCKQCFSNGVKRKRWNLGFKICLDCGEKKAREKKHCSVPMHKSNYVFLTDKEDLIGINQKGGLVR